MATIRLKLTKKTKSELLTFAKNVHTGLTSNANVPTPVPSLISLQAGIDAAQAGFDAYELEKDTLHAKKLARDEAFVALENLLRTEAVTVQTATGGDPAKIASTNFEVADAPTQTTMPPEQVMDLRVTATDSEGLLKSTWRREPSAHRYEIQASPDPIGPGTWAMKGSSNKTKALVNSFTSGSKVWLRVRAINAAGEGPWSDPALKTVP